MHVHVGHEGRKGTVRGEEEAHREGERGRRERGMEYIV